MQIYASDRYQLSAFLGGLSWPGAALAFNTRKEFLLAGNSQNGHRLCRELYGLDMLNILYLVDRRPLFADSQTKPGHIWFVG